MEQETLVYPLANNTVLQDKYTILNVLNAGGFGITYLALDNPHSRYVVIKECMPDAYAYRDMETGFVHPRDEQARRQLRPEHFQLPAGGFRPGPAQPPRHRTGVRHV